MASNKYKKRLVNKFIQIFLTTFALLMIIIGIGTIIFVVVSKQNVSSPVNSSDFSNTEYPGDTVGEDDNIIPSPFGDKKMTTFAVFGVDKDQYRTDVVMIVFFNHETAKVDIISVPRDTQVKIPDEIYSKIQARRNDVNQIVKINEVPAYIIEDRNETSVAVLEKTLGMDIDYYIKMNLDVFRVIVDEIGDVTVDIPFDMVYNDPVQDLYINIPKGEQKLNGAKAEQLIRFRSGYGTGDLGRINMQHEFMKAFAEQLLTDKNRLNMINILNEVMVRVETDFTNATDYLFYLDKIQPDSFEMHNLPGKADNSSRSYFIYDYNATKVLLNNIINKPYVEAAQGENGTTDGTTESVSNSPNSEGGDTSSEGTAVVDITPEEIVDVKSMTISVQNGVRVSGFAGRTKDKLAAAGYKPMEAIDFDPKGVERTRITVPAEEAFEELKGFFKNPEMIVKPSMMEEEMQIIVVLGQDDADNE